MATAETTSQVNTADNQSQNEYIVIVNKRIRALKKKLSNIEYIEAKVAKNEKINTEQQQVLQTKDYVQKTLGELEGMRNQFVTVFDKEQKEPKAPAKQTEVEPQPESKEPEQPVAAPQETPKSQPTYNRASDIREVLSILYASQLFDRNRVEGVEARKSFFSEQESQPNQQYVAKTDGIIDNIFYLVNFIFNSPSYAIDQAVESAEKFLTESSDDFSGVSYKTLHQIVTELVQSKVFRENPNAEEPVQEQAAVQVETQEETPVEEAQQQEPEEETVEEVSQESQESQSEDNKQRFASGGRPYRGRGGRGGGRARGGPRADRGSDRGGRGGSYDNRPRGGQQQRGGGAPRGSPRGGRKDQQQTKQ